MTIVGIDDTDSRTEGMCTTYLASILADAITAEGGTVTELVLVRLNPAVPHKTRGNGAVALLTDHSPKRCFELARERIVSNACLEDAHTQPGLVVANEGAITDAVTTYAQDAMCRLIDRDRTERLINDIATESAGWVGGRGRIGALAAIGAIEAQAEWTYEALAYRPPDRWGQKRQVDSKSVFDVADHPALWDTIDRHRESVVCVPNAPGPVLFGIRGDEPQAVADAAATIESKDREQIRVFKTNQGTDAHLLDGSIGNLSDDRAYRVDGRVASSPTRKAGGHVFFDVEADGSTQPAVAFKPTGRFRDHVESLVIGDEVTLCGERSDGTLKLEKFSLNERTSTVARRPLCPTCGKRMESAGRLSGYRCRACSQTASSLTIEPMERSIEPGWYEVPPIARRHIAKPLVRGGFDGPVHPAT